MDFKYIDNMIKNCELAKKTKPVRVFVVEDFVNFKDLVGITMAVYVIEEIGGDNVKTFNTLSRLKAKKGKIKYPKMNKASPVMYVGSSTSGNGKNNALKTRIRQHIGDLTQSVYALHMKNWFKGEYKITVMVYDEPREIIQIIEDNLSDRLKPAFGKQGPNTK